MISTVWLNTHTTTGHSSLTLQYNNILYKAVAFLQQTAWCQTSETAGPIFWYISSSSLSGQDNSDVLCEDLTFCRLWIYTFLSSTPNHLPLCHTTSQSAPWKCNSVFRLCTWCLNTIKRASVVVLWFFFFLRFRRVVSLYDDFAPICKLAKQLQVKSATTKYSVFKEHRRKLGVE